MDKAIDLSNRARRVARAKGLSSYDADNFAQDAYIQIAKGRKAHIDLMLVDFMRDLFGDSRYPNSMTHKLAYTDELPDTEASEPIQETALGWEALLKLVEPQDRPLVVLYYQWGLDLKEIGYALGVTEGRISQMLTATKNYLRKRVK